MPAAEHVFPDGALIKPHELPVAIQVRQHVHTMLS